MSSTVELNCVGMKCPRPIIEMAKAARRCSPGTTLRVVADDLAFERDLNAWCETTKAILVALDRDGTKLTATWRLAGDSDA